METEVSTESANKDQADENMYWKLVIPRERILFVKSPGTEEFDVFLTAMDEAMIVAMDAEWKPVKRAGVSPRVSILQMSCRIRKQSKAWETVERILLARKIRADMEESLKIEKLEVEKQRDDLAKQRDKLEEEREGMQEEVELEKRKVRADRENLKKERAEKKRRDKEERVELENSLIERERRRDDDDVVDDRPALTKLQDGLKGLVLGRNGEISEVAADLGSGVDVQQTGKNDATPTPKINTDDAEQNIDNLLDVLARAQEELMKHQEGEQRTEATEAKLETLSKDEDPEPESNYAFPDDKNLLEENGLRSKDTEIEVNKVDQSFQGSDLSVQENLRSGEETKTEASRGGGGGETEPKSSNEELTDTGSDRDDQDFSDAGDNEFEVDEEVVDSVPGRAGHSKIGEGLTEEESEMSQGEEVIFMLDLLALSAADFAFPIKKMLCSPKVLKLGFAFKNDQLHLAASFPDANGYCDKVDPYIDISKLYKQLLHANSAIVKHKGKRFVLGGALSLAGISQAVLGHPLRKDAQCSDWEQRPLTEDQIYYAAADTHCLLAIFDALLSDALALISPPPAHTEADDKPRLTTQQRVPSLRDIRGAGLKFFTGLNNIGMATPSSSYIYSPRMSTASQMVEAALRPSSPREPVATDELHGSTERFSKFVKKFSERLLVNESGGSKTHARRPRGKRAREALRNPNSKDELNLEWVGPAPWDVRIGGDGTPKFLCDVMVEGLARQLRCVGVDAASPPTKKSDPRQMVEQSVGEGRILLTKDIKLLRRRQMPDNLAYFVKKSGKWEQLEEVMKVFQITVSESELLSRCVKCNGMFTRRPLTSKEAKAQAPATQDIPRSVLETCDVFWQCSACGHVFWQGFQFDRARQKFAVVCVKPKFEDAALEDDAPIQSLDIACEFLEEPEKAFDLGGSSSSSTQHT